MSTDHQFDELRTHISQMVALNDADWELLRTHLTIEKFKKHEFFSENGKIANDVAFIIEGMFRQFYIKDGDEKTTYFFFENNLLCSYISCLTRTPSLVSIEALSSGFYIKFPYSVLEQLYQQSAAWQKFGRLIAEYTTIGLEARMADLLMKSPEERYTDLLKGNKNKILERIPQHYVANYLGITPVSMSRIRNRILKK
ncbi:MAG: Crp/Fnr family transcriptional regulator [Flavobacterium sp.]|nr:Crp/Fnr family transcriptional regulator [Flavobacterium sp.]